MTSPADWATAIRCTDILLRGNHRAASADEPALSVQQVARNPILCGGPVEYFSQNMPVWCPQSPDQDNLRPIDVLYGCYDPKAREILIFVNSIDRDASIYNAAPADLRAVVRIHEHAHAAVHLGSRAEEVYERLTAYGQDGKTQWPEFIERRTSWFTEFPSELHEFLAQALTYGVLRKLSVARRAETLVQVFDALESKQPLHYRLSSAVKGCAAEADWALVLEAARGAIDVHRELDFDLSAGLKELVSGAAGGREGQLT